MLFLPTSGNNEAGHPDATDLTQDFSLGNSDAMDNLTLGLGRLLGLELGHKDVPGLKNTGLNFLASGRLCQDVADPGNDGLLLGWGEKTFFSNSTTSPI